MTVLVFRRIGLFFVFALMPLLMANGGAAQQSTEPETARIVCESCEQPWTEAQRRNAVLRGEWRAQEPFHGTAGFHLNALVSPWIRLPELAREFIGSKDRPERL